MENWRKRYLEGHGEGGDVEAHPLSHKYHRYFHFHGIEKYRTLREGF